MVNFIEVPKLELILNHRRMMIRITRCQKEYCRDSCVVIPNLLEQPLTFTKSILRLKEIESKDLPLYQIRSSTLCQYKSFTNSVGILKLHNDRQQFFWSCKTPLKLDMLLRITSTSFLQNDGKNKYQ